jgi:hypothetical protein
MRTFKQLVPLAVAFAALATAGPALAERGRVFSSSFGEGQLSLRAATELSPGSGLAVDQATHDVYVADTANHRVDEFSASGAFIRAWGWGVTNGKAERQVCTTSSCRAGIAGSAPGQFDAPVAVAVDNSPTGEGDVYVAESGEFAAGEDVVQKFTKEGALLTSWGTEGQITGGPVEGSGTGDTTSGSEEVTELEVTSGTLHTLAHVSGAGIPPDTFVSEGLPPTITLSKPATATASGVPLTFNVAFFRIGGIGVDGEGNLRVADQKGLFEFSQTGAFVQRTATGGESILGLAVAPSGDSFLDAPSKVLEFEPGGGLTGTALETERSSTGVAFDSTSEELFVDEGTQIAAAPCPASAALPCAPITRFGAPQLTAGAGLAVDPETHAVYAANTTAGAIDVFIPEPAAAPKIEEESLTEATATGASFTAQIDPRSESGESATEYEFQYGLCASAESCASSGYEHAVPVPAGTLAPSFDAEAVSAHASGLSPKSTYHFRVVAKNSHGLAPGEEHIFATEGVGGELTLPDGRAWELVSPQDKFGASIEPIQEDGVVQAAVDGSGITYLANAPTEPDPQGNANEVQVLSSRDAGAWSTHDIAIPHASAAGKDVGAGPEYKAFDEDLTSGVVQPFGLFNPGLSEAATESTAFLHSLTTPAEDCTPSSSCYVPLVTRANDTTDPFQPFGEESLCQPGNSSGGVKNFCGPEFLGASEDLTHIVMRANRTELLAGAGSRQLYEWSGGSLTHVSVLPGPGEEPAVEPQLGLTDRAARHAVSTKGNRVFWQDKTEHLYVRDTERGETVELDLPQPTGCKECTAGGGGVFQAASADGSKVYFRDSQRLTADSGAVPGTQLYDLYECELTVSAGKLACNLTDLTPKHGEEGAELLGGILGTSEDGEWVYFAANGVLSANANSRGEHAEPGACGGESSFIEGVSCNLYVSHDGNTSFIARLSGLDGTDWAQALSKQPTRVSPNGEWLEFMSAGSPTGYDNRDAHSGAPAAEVYLYDAKTGRVICASCLPSGARPTGIEYKSLEPASGGLVGGPGALWSETGLVAANVPGWTAIALGGQRKEIYQPRYLPDSGRLFFDSGDRLVPQDSNGTQDVYQYEPAGITGSAGNALCTEASETFSATSGGCVSLISSGSSGKESAFLDASETGGDVFFLTSARLTSQDIDSSRDVYDAHECSSESPCVQPSNVQSPPCTNEASCKASPTPQPAIFGAPSSATFQGPGNLTPAPVVKAKAKPLTRAQKLNKALAVCHKEKKKAKRASCEKTARKKYGPIKKAKKKAKK